MMKNYFQKKRLQLGVFVIFTAFLLLNSFSINAQTFTDNTYPGASESWTVPGGVTSVTVQVWGGGGSGGGSNSNGNGGSGGGGGGYTTKTFAVSGGQIITYTIGTGGAVATVANGNSGQTTTVTHLPSGTSLVANGGGGGTLNANPVGAGGTASGGTNTSGSNGGAGAADPGGNGGNGGNALGTGGAGQSNANGLSGIIPGGGGGGGERGGGSSRSGGAGANGQIIITYAAPGLANDDCSGAIALTIGSSCSYTTYSNATATASAGVPAPGCASYSGGDVWFSFVVPANGQVTVDTQTGVITDSGMAFYSGTCGALTLISCDDDSSANGAMSTLTVSGRTPGETIYVRVWEYSNDNNGTFGICATSPLPLSAPCTYSATSGSYWISNVTTTGGFTNFNNSTAFSAGGYGDYYMSQSVNQMAGGTINFSMTNSSSTHGVNIYVDWNNDFDFADAGEKVYASGGYVSAATGSFIVPGAQAVGNYRMRVVSHFLNTDPPACSSETYTEAEDYRIVVSPPPTCYAPTVAANASSTTAGNASWIASALGTAPAGYQYVISTTNTFPGGAGTPIAGTSTSFTGLTPNTTYYVFVRTDCGGGDFSSWAVASFLTGYCTITSSGSTYYTNNFSTLGGITNITNNGSGFSAGGYGNFTAQAVSQAAGGSVSFSAAITGGTVGFGVWVDWNNDLDFNDVGEEVYMSNAFVSTATGFITVPATASVGNHRMRIVANSSTTVPSACGSGTNLEAEDYTFTVSPPLACSGNPSVVSVFIVSMTSSTISWTAATPAPASGYQYYLNTTGTPPVAATGATGTTAAGVTSATLTGLVAGTKYYVWVRSNCGGGTGQGTWVGPVIFTQPTCAVGPGTGTTTLGCPNTISGGLGLSGAPAPPINCSTAACANLEATFTPIKQTTSYTVASIAYAPPYQFNCLKNPVSVNIDDRWSPIVNLPFNFCFYGNTYNQCVIGSNGVLTFDTTKANTASGYSFANSLPSTTGALFANSIYGVYHDIDPSVSGEVGWELITLNTGCRALVASWNNVPMFSDNTILYTGMMVLYENTNIIEVYIKEKKVDGTWNGGNAIVGLQNAAGTLATVAPNRNGLDADWTATNEAWRFTPNGANVPTSIKWYEGAGTTGPVVGNTATVSVCPAATTVYTAELTYTLCNGLVYSNTAQTTVTVNTDKTWNGSSSTDWNTAANWTPSGVPTATQSVNIPVTGNNPIVGIGANALACSVTVQNGAVLTINAGFSITVTNAVTVIAGGTFNIKNTGSLVQVNNVTNSGNINMERIANLRLQDYCYWSSPVGNLLAGTFPVQSVSPLTPAGYIYKWATTTANTNGGFGTWVNTTENMIPAKGYILRGPTGFTNAAPSALTANFIGVPNNGIFTPTISRGTDVIGVGPNGILRTIQDDNWNLIGNPYPSAIDALTFLNLGANNTIDGAIRIWTHLTLPAAVALDPFYGNYVYNYTAADYIVYNKLGAQVGPGGFNGKIAAGQSFLVLMNNGGGAPSTATVTFNNTMRSATHNNSQFYKNSDSNKTTEEQHRLWIDLIAPTGTVNRTLLGYSDGATQAKENLYDAITDYKPSQNFYSIIDEEPMLIQGRALPFDTDDIVPMGMKIPTNGTYHIAIAAADGLFTAGGQTIYLEDKLLNVIHNLTASQYQFTATQGITNDRFVLRYTNQVLSDADYNLGGNNVTVFASNNEIQINSTTDSIKDYTVYNVLGQTLATKNNVNANQSIVNSIIKNNQTLIVKIVLENGQTVVKKIIF